PDSEEGDKSGPPISCGVIGLGLWGRELLGHLGRLPEASVAAICDTYAPFLKRGAQRAPKATLEEDYRKILENKEVQAVCVATPTHQHREIAIAALQAGKHVYCEAPLAHTLDDAKAIVKAAKAAGRQVFQAGLLSRSNPIHNHVVGFVHTGALGKLVLARAQFHRKQSWRAAAPKPEREKELNWRLDKRNSLGLAGEIGMHAIDTATWFHKAMPIAVHGFSSLLKWDDGRDVPDTIQAILEFPGGFRLVYDATLASSFEGNFEVHSGADSTIYLRDNRAWMIKETDAPLLGWEVHARREDFQPSQEAGLALVANSTKLLSQGKEPAEQNTASEPPLYHACREFLACIKNQRVPKAGFEAAYTANVLAIKTAEAVHGNCRIDLPPELFTV
ncbi:MAG TPA: Gfo/Idh/MocA family oxidoreductase, partial [Candidatus Paceibacterota bacterium]|nr:Gfo/Idh/MocA family oxidoreductase [Candidatus Paceibacterota bacterium]